MVTGGWGPTTDTGNDVQRVRTFHTDRVIQHVVTWAGLCFLFSGPLFEGLGLTEFI